MPGSRFARIVVAAALLAAGLTPALLDTGAVTAGAAPVAQPRPAQFRYGVVFAITLTLVLFEIAAPEADWARAAGVALGGAALTVAVSTSRARGDVRRLRGSHLTLSLRARADPARC